MTSLRPGDEGTYRHRLTTPEGVWHAIKWDNGSNTTLFQGEDQFKFLTPENPRPRVALREQAKRDEETEQLRQDLTNELKTGNPTARLAEFFAAIAGRKKQQEQPEE